MSFQNYSQKPNGQLWCYVWTSSLSSIHFSCWHRLYSLTGAGQLPQAPLSILSRLLQLGLSLLHLNTNHLTVHFYIAPEPGLFMWYWYRFLVAVSQFVFSQMLRYNSFSLGFSPDRLPLNYKFYIVNNSKFFCCFYRLLIQKETTLNWRWFEEVF